MCQGPITITHEKVVHRVACGHCMACARRRTLSWTLRLLLEGTETEFTDFVTLTYDQHTCPEQLDFAHLDKFLLRLRRKNPRPVRYFCVGEYGGKTGRPHWHVLLFGAQFHHRGQFRTALWPHGLVFTGQMERASVSYVCKYTLKSSSNNVGKKNLVRMSRRPGIGMRVLRSMAGEMANRHSHMAYFPPVIGFSGKTYWLDPRAYSACVEAYLKAGGELTSDRAPNNEKVDIRDTKSYNVDDIARKYAREVRHGKA